MKLGQGQESMLGSYLRTFDPLIGDQRTRETVWGTVQGIIGAESLICSRIAAFSPRLATASTNGAQRVRRMVKGESTQRSELDADHLIERLRTRGVERLADQDEVWAIVDPSELRKPYAKEMPKLMRVRALNGEGTVRGYRTLNVLGVGTGGVRALLSHRLFSSQAEDFASESREIQTALATVGEALVAKRGKVTYLMDSQFDDAAVWATIWEQGNHLVCRLKHQERLVQEERAAGEEVGVSVPIETARQKLQERARVRSEMLVRKMGQRVSKRQPTTAVISSIPIQVSYRAQTRSLTPGPLQTKTVWLVEVRLENVATDPWLLLTDWSVETETEAGRVFQMYRMRWAVEDCFKFTKDVVGWEDVQLLDFAGVRTLVALGWVAAGFLYELGVTLDWPEIRLLVRLGGGEFRPHRPPGKVILTRGLQRLLDHWATNAILADDVRHHGTLPPRIAAFLGPDWQHAS
jgi:hypothetical protein